MDENVEQYKQILIAQRQIARSKLIQNKLSSDSTQPQE